MQYFIKQLVYTIIGNGTAGIKNVKAMCWIPGHSKAMIAFLNKQFLETGSNSRVHLTTKVLDLVDPTTLVTPVSPMDL
jgi:hypothetical protein